jgi:hypothetical protein
MATISATSLSNLNQTQQADRCLRSPDKETFSSPNKGNFLERQWRHLELGGANYGKHNVSENQFQVLYRTIDELIQKYGMNGVIYLNDLIEEDCNYARENLCNYITQNYPHAAIQVEVLAKDYFQINIPEDLKVNSLNSIHLKNPTSRQFDSSLDQKWISNMLEYAKDGFTLTTHLVSDMDTYMLKAGEKSEQSSLRYEKSVEPAKQYIPYYTDESSREIAKSTYLFSIRKCHSEELFTNQEIQDRESKKIKIKENLKGIVDTYNSQLNEKVIQHSDFPLLAAFSQHWKQTVLFDETFPNFEEITKKLDSSLNLYKVQEEVYNDLKFYLQVKLNHFNDRINLLEIPLSAIPKFGGNFLTIKRDLSKKTPFELWERLGLGQAFKRVFPNDSDFWSSKKSLRTIYEELKKVAENNLRRAHRNA